MIGTGVTNIIGAFLFVYFWWVMFRAYKYLRDEVEAKQFGVKTQVYGYDNQGYTNRNPVYDGNI